MIEPKNGYLTVAPVYLSKFTCLSLPVLVLIRRNRAEFTCLSLPAVLTCQCPGGALAAQPYPYIYPSRLTQTLSSGRRYWALTPSPTRVDPGPPGGPHI